MNAEDAPRFGIGADDIRRYPWQETIAGHPDKSCFSYHQLWAGAATKAREVGDGLGERVYSLLSVVASFYPSSDSDMNPYRAMLQESNGRRTLIPDDLTQQDLDALQGILHEIEDAEYRARVADVLWVCRKDYKAAQIAVGAFLEAAGPHKTSDLWPPYVERIDRAARIAARKGFEKERATVVETVEAAIKEFESEPESGLLCSHLMGILLLLGAGDPSTYSALSEKLARAFTASGQWHFAEIYWATAENWHRRIKDERATQRSMIEAAECLVARANAEAGKQPPQNGTAAHWMGKALESLRRAKGDPARIKDIHRRMLALQKMALGELRPFDFNPDSIPGLKEGREKVQQAARAHVGGLDFQKAVLRLAHIGEPTNVEDLIESERKNSEGLIWDKLFGANQLDRDGKVAGIMPALGIGGDDPDQVAFRTKLVHSARMSLWPLAVEWRIEPARRVISMEHPVRARDLAFLVSNNPFIRPGHEGIYLQGIQAGFFGDWLLAMHLLIPQLEDSVRFVLQQHGVVTSTLKQGIQMERDINELLWDMTAEDIFGPDYLFDLRGILIERFGGNMRNESAHGLMSEAAFYSAESVYLWWLVIRLCWIGLSAVPPEEPAGEDCSP